MILEHHANKRQDNPCEADNRQIRGFFGPPTHGKAAHQDHKVEHPGRQGPRLLRVPLEIRALDQFRRDRPGDHAEGEQGEAQNHGFLVEAVQEIQRRQFRIQDIELL